MARPSKPLISRETAAKAALEVIDEVGLDKLSLDRVSKKLRVQPPSLYHHFSDKAELMAEVARVILTDLPDLKTHGATYEERLVSLCVATRRSLLRHPNAAVLLLQFFPRHLLLSAYEQAATEDPYPPEFHMAVIEGTEKLTFGSALFAAAAQSQGVKSFPPFDADKYPAVARAVASNPYDDEKLFEATIRMFLAGVAETHRQALTAHGATEKSKPAPQKNNAPRALRGGRRKVAAGE